MTAEPAAARGGEGVAARIAAWRILRRVDADAAWSGPVVDTELRRSRLDERDRAFAANLAYSTLRWQGTLDWALTTVVTRPLERVEPAVLDVLRLGAWQLLYGDSPDRAAVDTAVSVAREQVGDHVAGFVNGVLRALARSRERLPWPSEHDDAGLALRSGYPAWVVASARERFGERARAVLEAGNVPPGLVLRATGDPAGLLAELRRAGFDATPGRLVPEAVNVPHADPGALACVAEGRAVVQDEASMVVARAAAPPTVAPGTASAPMAEPSWRVLDACAAPGGKTTHLAQLGATVAAADVRPNRAGFVRDAAARTGMAARVGVAVADAARPPWRAEAFDAVLVDAPCTGFGVVRRRPELRWRRTPGDAERLAGLQLRLLEAAAPLVRPGGVLVYSACTWTVAETVGVATGFTALYGDRFTLDAATLTPAAHRRPSAGDPGVQLSPDVDGSDGMYLCRWRAEPS